MTSLRLSSSSQHPLSSFSRRYHDSTDIVLRFVNLQLCVCILLCLVYGPQWGVQSTWFLDSLQLSAVGVGRTSTSGPVHAACDKVPSLAQKQRRLCYTHPRVMVSLVEGAKLALRECGHQFRYDRWNCSVMQTENAEVKRILDQATKETAFLYAISSAGAVHAVTKACSQGQLGICECDPSKRGEGADQQGKFTWGGCSDHIRFGMRMARTFMDAKDRETEPDARTLMNLHNNKAGRRIVWRHRDQKCKCHGVSGACSMRTCWQRMLDFRHIGEIMKQNFEKSLLVFYDNNIAPTALLTSDGGRPGRQRLVYLQDSPNFCQQDAMLGHPGVDGRECNSSRESPDSCDKLCCGRPFETFRVNVTEECECKFYWCCHVKCKTCSYLKTVHRCKGK